MTNLMCPVCGRASWMTRGGLIHHLVKDHTHQVLAEELTDVAIRRADAIAERAAAQVRAAQAAKCGKKTYPSRDAALRALLSTWQRNSPIRKERRTYYCNRCAAWHLTKQPERASTEGATP